ncbi:MAG TPA: ATP-binding protein, partial [Actinomycetota bacterium]|nr:ATP-binding protein [Actinomycetota bacterium]
MAASTETRIAIESEADLVRARQRGRELAGQMGFSPTDATLIATAISEVARNILTYAGTGEIVLGPISENGQEGMVMIALDTGP